MPWIQENVKSNREKIAEALEKERQQTEAAKNTEETKPTE